MIVLVLDFETKDYGLADGEGPGWPWGGSKILGAGVLLVEADEKDLSQHTLIPYTSGTAIDTGEELGIVYEQQNSKIIKLAQTADMIIAHTAQYELGHLLMLGVDIKGKRVIDIKVASKLNYNVRREHNLDYLSKTILKDKKSKQKLIEAGVKVGLIKEHPKLVALRKAEKLLLSTPKEALAETKAGRDALEKYENIWEVKKLIAAEEKAFDKKALKFMMSNLDLLQEKDPRTVAEYCNHDVLLTWKLALHFCSLEKQSMLEKYSYCENISARMRKKGVRIDLAYAKVVEAELAEELDSLEKQFVVSFGEVNYNSPKQIAAKAKEYGLKPRKKEERVQMPSGRWQVVYKDAHDKEWRKTNQGHPFCDALEVISKVDMRLNGFVRKWMRMAKNGRLHPELNLLEARTGRFSSSNPNLQQVPKRGEEEDIKKIRSLFIPDEGKLIADLDFSAQEPRLAISVAYRLHKAGVINVPSLEDLVKAYRDNPNLDFHSRTTAAMLGIAEKDVTKAMRNDSKDITLGNLYGMGRAKLLIRLGRGEEEGDRILERYDLANPWVKASVRAVEDAMREKHYIHTFKGRRSYSHGEDQTAFNSRVQGSGADQLIEALLWADREDIEILFPVHDSILAQGEIKDFLRLQYIMEHAIILAIPSVTDIMVGKSWGELEKYDNKIRV